jgi:pumilio homology domain family member 6
VSSGHRKMENNADLESGKDIKNQRYFDSPLADHLNSENDHIDVDVSRKNESSIAQVRWVSKRKVRGEESPITYRRKKFRHFDLLQQAKTIWERLRVKSKSSHEPLVKELIDVLSGKLYEFITKHDASRIVQTMIKYGGNDQRLTISQELQGHYVELSRAKYGKFLVTKILKYCPSQRSTIISEFRGHVTKLIRHREAATVINTLYTDYCNANQRASLIEEFYGPQFALFKADTQQTLEEFLVNFPEKKEGILGCMEKTLKTIVDKGTLRYYFVHRILWQFFRHAEPKRIVDILEILKEHLVEILHTKEGSRVAMRCLAFGNAKDRKLMVKPMKSFTPKICKEEYGHWVIFRLFDSVDDIVLITKSILQDMEKNILDIALDRYGSKILLYPFHHRSTKCIDSYLKDILMVDDELSLNTTKKQWDVKSAELIQMLTPSLIGLCRNHTKTLITSSTHTAEILIQTILHAGNDRTELMTGVISLTANLDLVDNIMEHCIAHRALKCLIRNDPTGDFAKLLLSQLESSIVYWSQQKSASFVILALLEHSATSESVRDLLFPHMVILQQIENPGTQIIQSTLYQTIVT